MLRFAGLCRRGQVLYRPSQCQLHTTTAVFARKPGDGQEISQLHEKLRAILSTPRENTGNDGSASSIATPEPAEKSIQKRLSDILAQDVPETKSLGKGKQPNQPVSVEAKDDPAYDPRIPPQIHEYEGALAQYNAELNAILDKMELEEFPRYEINPDIDPTIEVLLEDAEARGDLEFVTDVDENADAHVPKGVRGLEILAQRDGSEVHPLTEEELFKIAKARVAARFGTQPNAHEHRLVEAELRRLKLLRLSPAAVKYFRRLRSLAPDQMDPRGHPRAQGFCQLSGPAAPPLVHENVNLLSQYITYGGQIKPGRVTGVSARNQRLLARAIKRSRQLGLIPYMERLPLPMHTLHPRAERSQILEQDSDLDSPPQPSMLVGSEPERDITTDESEVETSNPESGRRRRKRRR